MGSELSLSDCVCVIFSVHEPLGQFAGIAQVAETAIDSILSPILAASGSSKRVRSLRAQAASSKLGQRTFNPTKPDKFLLQTQILADSIVTQIIKQTLLICCQ